MGYPEKGRAVLCKGARLKYRFINEHRTVWGVMTMCRVLNVARAGFYAWLHNPVSARDKDNQRLLTLIRDSYSLSGGVYGYRRVHGDLNEIGETCGKNRVDRIMQLNRIKAVRGYKAPRRIAGRLSVVAPNRVQRQTFCCQPFKTLSPFYAQPSQMIKAVHAPVINMKAITAQ